MDAPEKIYINVEYDDFYQTWSIESSRILNDTAYIRADIVDGLVEALEQLLDQFDSEIRSEYDGTFVLESRLAEADHARAALAKARGE